MHYMQDGGYSSYDLCNRNIRVRNAVYDLISGKYCADRERFRNIYDDLTRYNDEFFVVKDFQSYIDSQDKVDSLYNNKYKWQQKCGINIAHSGVFSSDRTIQQYVTGIWGSELMYKNL